MNRRGLQPLGVVVPSFRLLKSFHLLITLRKKFTERIIHYRQTNEQVIGNSEQVARKRLPAATKEERKTKMKKIKSTKAFKDAVDVAFDTQTKRDRKKKWAI